MEGQSPAFRKNIIEVGPRVGPTSGVLRILSSVGIAGEVSESRVIEAWIEAEEVEGARNDWSRRPGISHPAFHADPGAWSSRRASL